MNSLSGNG